MKRIICFCLTFMILISAAPSRAAEVYNCIILNESFETAQYPWDKFEGNCIDSAFGTGKGSEKCLSASVPTTGDRYFSIKHIGGIDQSKYISEKKIKLSFDVKLSSKVTAIADVRAKPSSGDSKVWINIGKFKNNGKLAFDNIEKEDYLTNQWYSFEAYFDFENESADIYMDGTAVSLNKSISGAAEFYDLRIQLQDAASSDVKFLIDNVRLAAYGEPPEEPKPEPIPTLESTVFFEDFEGEAVGSFSNSAWEYKQASGISHEIRESEYDTSLHKKVLTTNFPKTQEGTTTAATDSLVALNIATLQRLQNYKANSQFWEIDFDYLFTQSGSVSFNFWGSDETKTSRLINIARFNGDGTLSVYGGATDSINFESYKKYETGKWYNIRIYLNLADDTYSLWLDDNEIVREGNLQYQLAAFLRPRFDILQAQGVEQDGNGRMYLDNMRISCPGNMTVTAQSLTDGYIGFPTDGMISFIWSTPIKSVDTQAISVIADGAEIPFDVVAGKDSLTLDFANRPLEFDTQYKLIIEKSAVSDIFAQTMDGDITLEFKTMSEEIVSGMPYFTNASGEKINKLPLNGNISVKAEVKNYTSGTQGAVLIAALYNADGTFNSLLTDAEGEIAASGGKKTLSIALPNADYSGKTIRAITVNNLTELKAVSNGFSELSEDDEKQYTAGGTPLSITVNGIETGEAVFKLNGNVAPTGQHIVTVEVKDADGKLLAAEPMQTMTDGSFIYSYTLSTDDAAKSGESRYDFTVNSRDAEKAVNRSAYYINEATRIQICNAINTAADAEAVRNVFLTYKNSFNIENDMFCESNYQIIYEQRPHNKYEDIVKMISDANAMLDKIKAMAWSDITDFLAKNNKIVLYGEESSYEVYEKLSKNEKAAVNKLIADYGAADTVTKFRQNFVKAMASQTKKTEKGGGSSSGGRVPRIDVSVGTSAPVSTGSAKKYSFNDIHTVQWAENAINSLAELNVVNGYDDGSFRPNNMVKREEFVKMLVLGLKLEPKKTSVCFKDVDTGAWYAEYIAAAKEAGIVVGDENGCFGTGKYITRQDVCVMLWRAMKTTGKITDTAENIHSFADENTISDYAKEAVKAFFEMGVINGMEDNTFRPFETATRAQNAKIIYSVISKL